MYDVIVIGGGPGGYAAGIRSSQLGAKVALLEPTHMGGTCVNRGCIPAKIWMQAARRKQMLESADVFGIKSTIESVDLQAIVDRRNGVPSDLQMGMAGLCKNYGIDVFAEQGVMQNPREVKIEGKTLEAEKMIVATGCASVVPDIPGIGDPAMSTDEMLGMTRIPASILIYGAEAMEVEMAVIMNTFGAKVYLATEGARILPKEDGNTSQRVAKALREQGIEVLPRFRLESMKESKGGYEAELSGRENKTIAVERVLSSIRRPNTDLGLDQAGVELDEEGFIIVNDHLETSAENIYAIGDVTGGWMLSFAATSMGVAAAENAMGQISVFNSNLVPRGLWTLPEAAAVGISEEDADEMDLDVEIGDCPMSVNGVAMAYDEMDGNIKVISDAEYGEILGVHIVGGPATEMIWGASMAMQLEATVDDLAHMVTVHPTFSENIALAGQDSRNWALYLPRR